MKKVLSLLVIAAILLSFSAAFAADAKERPTMVGKEFIEVGGASWLNSDPIKLADHKGKVILLEFWATWCPPCKKSIPHLIELYGKYKDKGVVFVAFTDEAKETVEPFAKEMKMTYPIAVGSTSGKDYNVSGIPHAVLIGTDGKVAWEGHPMDKEFEKNLEELAAKAGSGATAAPAKAEEKKDDKAAAPAEKKDEHAPSGK